MIPNTRLWHKITGFLDNDLIVSYVKRTSPLKMPEAGRIFFSEASAAAAAAGTTLLLVPTTLLLLLVIQAASRRQ